MTGNFRNIRPPYWWPMVGLRPDNGDALPSSEADQSLELREHRPRAGRFERGALGDESILHIDDDQGRALRVHTEEVLAGDAGIGRHIRPLLPAAAVRDPE